MKVCKRSVIFGNLYWFTIQPGGDVLAIGSVCSSASYTSLVKESKSFKSSDSWNNSHANELAESISISSLCFHCNIFFIFLLDNHKDFQIWILEISCGKIGIVNSGNF